MKWTENYTVNAHDMDMNEVLSLTGVLRYMQDAANCQMEGEGPSYAKLLSQGRAFVVSRVALSIYGKVHSHDRIQVQSWACESSGVSFNRCYSVIRNGEIVAEATSVWALLDINTKKLVRVSDFRSDYSMDEMLELDAPSHFRLPSDVPMNLVGERTVEYQDVDMNRHMNNTRYGDILCGYIPSMEGMRVIKLVINYCSEAPIGETLKVYMGRGDTGTYYFRTVRDGGKTNVEAEIMIEKI